MVRAWSLVALGVFSVVSPAFAQSSSALRKPLIGKAPPELIFEKEHWLAGPGESLQQLKGKVVWLQFNF